MQISNFLFRNSQLFFQIELVLRQRIGLVMYLPEPLDQIENSGIILAIS